MRHVFIATPVLAADPRAEYVSALIQTMTHLSQNRIIVSHSFCIGNSLVHDARNRLVSWFLAYPDTTDLLFIDADIYWEPKDALRLITSPHDVIGGAYRKKTDDAELYNVSGIKTSHTGLLEVDYLGTGFLKISRKAIEKMMRRYPEFKYNGPDGRDAYGLFQAPIADGKLTGEDAFFCQHWGKIGGKVWLDPDMTLHHVGSKAYRGNFREMIERAEREVESGKAA